MLLLPVSRSSYEKVLKTLPSLVVSDTRGNLFDIPEYGLAVRRGTEIGPPGEREVITLPQGSDLHMLPGRYPVGIDRKTGEGTVLRTYRGTRVFAASAFVAPAYTLLADTLIQASTLKDFDYSRYRDLYKEKLTKLIQMKIEGQEVIQVHDPEEPKIINLMEALKRSVAEAQAAGGQAANGAEKSKAKAGLQQAPSAKPGRAAAAKKRKVG